MPSSKALKIEQRVDAALRLRVTQLERALAQAEARNETLWRIVRRYRQQREDQRWRADQGRVMADEMRRDRDVAWRVCAQLARHDTGNSFCEPIYHARSGHLECRYCTALCYGELVHDLNCPTRLVQPQCGHPIAAITRNPNGTQSCRACAIQATEAPDGAQ